MPYFSESSRRKLLTCDARIIEICVEVILYFDYTVIWGHRSNEHQDRLLELKRTLKRGGQSVHNCYPSRGIDLAPFPVDWHDEPRFAVLAGAMLYVARKKGIELTWGMDWDRDGSTTDTTLRDWGHFQVPPR